MLNFFREIRIAFFHVAHPLDFLSLLLGEHSLIAKKRAYSVIPRNAIDGRFVNS